MRWHSPKDWIVENDGDGDGDGDGDEALDRAYGLSSEGHLSKRMAGKENAWAVCWETSPVMPVTRQQRIFEPNREAEKVLNYLETLTPAQVLTQVR